MEQYISKAAVVAEIERRVEAIRKAFNEPGILSGVDRTYANAQYDAFKSLFPFLDTLEVKGVDLDKECRKYLTEHFNVYEDGILQSKRSGTPLDTFDVIQVAKHFFELGLKTKGE